MALICAGCGFDKVGDADLATADLSMASADLAGVDLAGADLAKGATKCRTLPLPCLAAADVIDVPAEATVQDAFAQAKSGDTVQIRGLSLGAGFRVPFGVTLHGCESAKIVDTLAFEGSLGIVEGFEVSGSVIANRTGTFFIRANRFVSGGATNLAGVSVRANEGIVSANVTVTIEGNWFDNRNFGIEGLTDYDTLVHTLNLTVRNNVFYGIIQGAITLDEGGLVGQINAQLSFNTFVSCPQGIKLTSVQSNTPIRASVFYLGAGNAVVSDSPYFVSDVYYYGAVSSVGAMPVSGSFTMADPLLVDWLNQDLHLLPGSPLLDKIPSGPEVPVDDYYGCARPVGGGADVGAIENQ